MAKHPKDSRDSIPRVGPIDHVEVFVPNRHEAAQWYQEVLGFDAVRGYEGWALNPRGPLMISSDDGTTKLALFEGEPQGTHPRTGPYLVAFRVDSDTFLAFLDRLSQLGISNHDGALITRESAVDHGSAWSVYFSDPYGNRLEITTYDFDATRDALAD